MQIAVASECQAICSVASSGAVGVGRCCLTSHDGVLAVSCYFLLCLLGRDEFVSGIASRIEPLHENRCCSGFRFCQRDGSIIGGLLTLRCDGQKSSVKNSAI